MSFQAGGGLWLLVESKGGWTQPGAGAFLADAAALAGAGHRVRVFLVEDGVFAAAGAGSGEVRRLVAAGAKVWVDGFSAEQRALGAAGLCPGAVVAGMDEVAAVLAQDGCRAVWH